MPEAKMSCLLTLADWSLNRQCYAPYTLGKQVSVDLI